MADIARVRIPTRELVFSIRNEVELPALGEVRMREITTSDTYIAVSYYDRNEMTRLVHLYASDKHIVALEEDGTESQVLIADSVDDILGSLLSLLGDTNIHNESLNVPANILVGLMASATEREATDFLKTHTNTTEVFSIELFEDIYNAVGQEHYVAYSNKNSQLSFVKFIKGSKGLWRVSSSSTKGNLFIKPIPTAVYRESVAFFLKEMVK